jgi:hypothetical protein
MGHISYLTGVPNNGPQSIDEALYELENTSVLFREAWQRVPPDLARAARVSANAMRGVAIFAKAFMGIPAQQ